MRSATGRRPSTIQIGGWFGVDHSTVLNGIDDDFRELKKRQQRERYYAMAATSREAMLRRRRA